MPPPRWDGWDDDEDDDTPGDPGVRHVYTPAEAERLYGIPAGTVRQWAKRKRIRAFHVEGRVSYYDRADLLRMRSRVQKDAPSA